MTVSHCSSSSNLSVKLPVSLPPFLYQIVIYDKFPFNKKKLLIFGTKKELLSQKNFALSHLSRLYLSKAIVNILPQNSFVNLLLLLFLLLLFIIFSWNFYSKFLLFSLIYFSFSCIFSSIFFVRKHISKFVVTYLFYLLRKNVNFCEICTLLSLFIYISSIYFYHFLTLINTFTHILPNRL